MRIRLIGFILLFLGGADAGNAASEFSFLRLAQTTQKSGPPASEAKPLPGVLGIPSPPPVRPGQTPPRTRPQAQPQSRPSAGRQTRPQAQQPPANPQPAAPQTASETAPQPQKPPAKSRPAAQSEQGLAFSFTNAPIENVVSAIMEVLNYTYVIDPRVSGNVNLYTRGEIPKDRLFAILEQLLNLNGQAIVRQDDLYIILPIAASAQIPGSILLRPMEAQASAPPIEEQAEPGSGQAEPAPSGQSPPPSEGSGAPPPQASGQQPGEAPGPTVLVIPELPEDPQLDEEQGVITYIIPLHYIPSSEAVMMIKAFASDGAQVVDFQSANTLIITDYRANIRQILKMIELLDTRYFDINTVDLIQIRYNKAEDVAEDLGKVFAPGDTAGGVRIVAIERLNSILVVTHSPAVFSEVKRWIDKLDISSSGTNVKTFVYQVLNNTAANIAEILAQLYEDGTGLPSGPGEEGEGQPAQQPRRRQEAGFLPEQGQAPGHIGPTLGGRSPQSGVRAVVSGNVKIIVNEFNNSLIIQGTEADYQFLSQTIRLLDILPRQVLIEAEIYSVELRDDLSFGISSFLQERGTQFPAGDDATSAEGTLPPPTLGSISGGTLTASTRLFVGQNRQLGFLINALRSKTNVEILESPSLLVVDGTEAQINVGAEVPVSTTSFSDPLRSGDTAFVNSIQFRPTGTTLLLLPRISASGIVTMELAVEISSATGGGATGLTPTINRNYVQTTLIAQDNETIMIAGIISDTFDLGRDRVPLLGDIPILGALFGQTSKNKRRFELVFLITPRVVRNLPTAIELTLDFKRGLRNAYDFIDRKDREQEELKDRHRKRELQKEQKPEEQPEEPKPPR